MHLCNAWYLAISVRIMTDFKPGPKCFKVPNSSKSKT